jgi:sorting nexin-8
MKSGLPQPQVSYIDRLRTQAAQQASPPSAPSPQQTPSRPAGKPRQDSLDPSSDPWASPKNSRAPPLYTAAHSTPTNGLPNSSTQPASNSVTSATPVFSTQSSQPSEPGPLNGSGPGAGATWGSYNASTSGGFSDAPTIGGGGFGEAGEDQLGRSNHNPQRSVSGALGAASAQGTGETITVAMLPEKEGMFMFQHHNYEVKSFRRGSSVIRRYSDFVWLLDCLQKRYAFRRLPLLPPKRVQVNGTHLAGDAASFLEKRRRGLVRFANQLVQHPVLNQEQLVIMFLTVPTVSCPLLPPDPVVLQTDD